MKIDLTKVFIGVDDQPMIDSATHGPITLKMTLINAALADVDENGQPIRGDAKVKRFDIYLKLKSAKEEEMKEFEITPEEATLLRAAVGVYPTLIAGQARAALA